jgi:hypothetical protein
VTVGAARNAGPGTAQLTERDLRGLLFTADMYGLQSDLLADLLGLREEAARRVAARWRRLGYVETARLGPGPPWTWLTRRGLNVCGLRYAAVPPALSRLAHIRAVAVVRLALESAPSYQQADAYWRSERRIRGQMGGRVGLREHLPDGEVHFPHGGDSAFADECWAVEAELTRKTVRRTAEIMRELLTRNGDYGCPAAEAIVPGPAAPAHPGAVPVLGRGQAHRGPGGR